MIYGGRVPSSNKLVKGKKSMRARVFFFYFINFAYSTTGREKKVRRRK